MRRRPKRLTRPSRRRVGATTGQASMYAGCPAPGPQQDLRPAAAAPRSGSQRRRRRQQRQHVVEARGSDQTRPDQPGTPAAHASGPAPDPSRGPAAPAGPPLSGPDRSAAGRHRAPAWKGAGGEDRGQGDTIAGYLESLGFGRGGEWGRGKWAMSCRKVGLCGAGRGHGAA
ncbi:hypothetical protein PLESTB_001247000 [Pleodorina starrii]|uniref:Uncharacterized protein n=1 Tax=Pleodorina starrii TaxID=330485 RepID=A0A9W6BU94_9CHLO|nr:hypothetical protein PLESTB_001247000 [Pleodorina starrii]